MQCRSFIQATPSFSRKGRLRDTAPRTAASLTGAGSSARTAALMEPRQNRVAKITRVIVDLTRLMVAPPSQKNSSMGAPSRFGWRSRGSGYSLPPFDGTVNPRSARACGVFRVARRLVSCEILADGVHLDLCPGVGQQVADVSSA